MRRLAALAAACLVLACSREEPVLAGGWADTETGHKVAGVILREDGSPAAGALIILRPEDYLGRNPATGDSIGESPTGGTLAELACDSAGRFALDSVAPGRYALESRHLEINAVLLRFAMGKEPVRLDLGSHRVKPTGSITGRVRFSDGVPGPALVRIRGLEHAVLADPATGVFAFGNLPEGEHTLRLEGLEPGVEPAGKPGVRFAAGGGTNAGETVLQRGLRQGFLLRDGMVELPGVDSANPVILENGGFRSPMDGAYLFAKAALGRVDLRGIITSYGKDTGAAAMAGNLAACARQIAIARQSGLDLGALAPTAGASRPLARPRSGNLMDIDANPGPGAELLYREAMKATAARPLVLLCGTNLTTAAQALLAHPGMADRMVVIGANNGNMNADDSLAAEVVARKGRFVAWSRDHWWDAAYVSAFTPAHIPGRLGEALRGLYDPVSIAPTWAYSYYGDFGPATWLFRRGVWKAATPSLYAGPPLKAVATAAPVFDFVDIPRAANDWGAIEAEFYGALEDTTAYRPWPVPGEVEGEGYFRSAHASVDTLGLGEALYLKAGGWAEWNLRAEVPADRSMEVRYRCDSACALTAAWNGGAADTLRFPAVRDGVSPAVPVTILAGTRRLRLNAVSGAVAVERIGFR